MGLTDILHTPVTLLLLVVTVGVSIAGFNNPRFLHGALLDVQAIVKRHEYHRLLTSGFVHADPMHLFVNMLTLFFLGPSLELMAGSGGMLLVYFLSLLAGSGWTLLEHHRNRSYRALGASGAISGVTVVFALFAPFAMLIVFILPVPAILFAAFYIGWSIYASRNVRDGIGHDAHLGGALMGLVLVCLIWPSAIDSLIAQILRAI
ncbi:MAG: rhomboid family intramembrane serine protease [Alphaproteobacteria bacterium]|nr:rhomboid family intramembrane serine protease [Alphaproteobacteria bacterium]